ncbi:MAG: hypothetical protein HFH94_13525 [Lachnospiraceae bacterium]|nr:hypothetical protein [uncultured Acetatifactor sp.]MCI9220738.1 hypothetical protein [Lachnospiraceae bacterium]
MRKMRTAAVLLAAFLVLDCVGQPIVRAESGAAGEAWTSEAAKTAGTAENSVAGEETDATGEKRPMTSETASDVEKPVENGETTAESPTAGEETTAAGEPEATEETTTESSAAGEEETEAAEPETNGEAEAENPDTGKDSSEAAEPETNGEATADEVASGTGEPSVNDEMAGESSTADEETSEAEVPGTAGEMPKAESPDAESPEVELPVADAGASEAGESAADEEASEAVPLAGEEALAAEKETQKVTILPVKYDIDNKELTLELTSGSAVYRMAYCWRPSASATIAELTENMTILEESTARVSDNFDFNGSSTDTSTDYLYVWYVDADGNCVDGDWTGGMVHHASDGSMRLAGGG